MKISRDELKRILTEEVINYYRQGYNLPDISEATGAKVDKVKYILKSNGILKEGKKEK